MPVGTIVANFDYGVGVDEIAEQFENPGAANRDHCCVRAKPSHCTSCLIKTSRSVSAVSLPAMKSAPSLTCMGPAARNGKLLNAAEAEAML